MNSKQLIVLCAVVAMASAQLFGGMGGEMGGGMAPNPMLMMSLMQMAMADPSAMSFPVVSMLFQNPGLMQNPAMLFSLSGLLGVDMNKLIGPMMMANNAMPGGGNSMGFMGLLPFMGGVPDMNMLTTMMMLGMPGFGMGGGMGGMGGMGGLGSMALAAGA